MLRDECRSAHLSKNISPQLAVSLRNELTGLPHKNDDHMCSAFQAPAALAMSFLIPFKTTYPRTSTS